MSLQAVLLPLFVQVALTFGLVGRLAILRTRALDRREVRVGDIALGQKAWPERILKIGNSFQNQLELPVLFYVLVILALIAHKADLIFVILSWAFVASRLVHAFIHTGSNVVHLRGAVYGAGMFVLIVMWVIFAVQVLAS
jgi:hypothetical protein